MKLLLTRHVLIVEDDADIRETLADLLESEGMAVTQAEEGGAALAALGAMSELPDLILLDLMMPGMDGHAFREAQRTDPRFANIPVVVMSADPHLASYAERLAARQYVQKPFDVDQILAAMAA